MEYVQNCPRSNPRRGTNQIRFPPVPPGGVLLAGFGEGHPGSGKRGILPRVRGHTVRLPGRCRHGHPPLRGGHMRAEDAARGPSEHASQTYLRGAARQLPVQDRYPRNAHGARSHAGLKLLPSTHAGTALSSTWIQYRMSVISRFVGSCPDGFYYLADLGTGDRPVPIGRSACLYSAFTWRLGTFLDRPSAAAPLAGALDYRSRHNYDYRCLT